MRQLLLAADAPGAAIRTYLGSLSVLIIDVIIFIFARAVSWRQLLCCWLLAAPSPVFPRRSLGALSAPSLRPQSRDSSLGPESGPLSPCLPLGRAPPPPALFDLVLGLTDDDQGDGDEDEDDSIDNGDINNSNDNITIT